jgi:uncharacterized protein
MVKKRRKKIEDLQIQDMKVSFKFILIVLLVILIVVFLLDSLVDVPEGEEVEEIVEKKINSFFSLDGSTRVKMHLPAVDTEGNGVNTILTVEATPGSGRTLTDIDNLLFWADTQHSMRIARRVAENITGKKVENYNIVYTIEANASLIGGPSAGAALTVATIAALEGRELRENVMITGSINHDGSIGPVTAILEKASASKDIGAEIFLVPLAQSRDVIYETTEHCEVFGHTEICTTETKPRKIEVEQESGIEIREVGTVQDAMLYFFG